MRKIILSFALSLIISVAMCQNERVQIIFDVTSSDIKVHEAAVRHIKSMSEAYPESEFEMVIYSNALPMMLKNESSVVSEIENLVKYDNVLLNVCAMSLKKHQLTDKDLIRGVETVPDGIMEIVNKQNQGWGYIKEAN